VAVSIAWLLRARARRMLFGWLQDGLHDEAWHRLPERIIIVRHGEAEHNLEHGAILHQENPNRKPDNLSELTALGRLQAFQAGERIRDLLGNSGSVSVVVSPFERTQQTLYSLQKALDRVAVRCVHVDPRVREQEFGNFQIKDDMLRHSKVAQEVGRFYYRRPTGESGCDVYDRAASFWDSLLCDAINPQNLFAHRSDVDDALLIVTHGLTMRILLMRYFNWSPQTFDAVYNPGNGDMWVLVKDEARRQYRIEPESCTPQGVPWATRQVRLKRRDSTTPREYTLVDYLALPQPRTSHPEAALEQLIEGHGHKLDPSKLGTAEERAEFLADVRSRCVNVPKGEVEEVDWWCGKISDEGVKLRTADNVTNRRASLLHEK